MKQIIPPQAKRKPQITVIHGYVRRDDYAWLRNKKDPEVIAHLEEENRYTEQMTRHIEALKEELFNEMKSRIKETDRSAPVLIDDYWYYYRTEEGKQYPIYCRKKHSLSGPEEILLDPNEMARGHSYFHLGVFEISPDHRKLAYSVDFDGSERYTLFIRDLETGKLFSESISNTYYSLAWMNDSEAFFYTVPDEASRPHKVYKHILGTSPETDSLIYHEPDERFHIRILKTRSKKYILIFCRSMITTEVRYLRADRHKTKLRVFQPREQGHEYYVDHSGNTFFVMTNDNAKNFRVVKTSTRRTRKTNWKEIIPHRKDVTIEQIEAFSEHLVVRERAEGLIKIHVFNLKTGANHYISFLEPTYWVWIKLKANPVFETSILRFIYSSLVTPDSTFDYDMNTRERTLVKQKEVLRGYDPARYKTEYLFVKTHDGTKIPISLAYKQDIKRDGSSPLFLYGYGAYGAVLDSEFDSNLISLLDRGFIYAIAHVRGGGKMGRGWYEDGKFLKKKNTFNDFIACAEYLIKQKYTSKKRIVISGGSAGGLLIGAVLNMRPDLWGAAIARVPFVDIVNTILDPSLPLTVIEYEEWGNPNDKTFYDYMVSYSPYDQVRRQNYPKILVTAGLNDPRVHYWEPAKWVAKLRRMKTDNNPILLKINMESGHAGMSGRYDRLREIAFRYAFAIDALGLV